MSLKSDASTHLHITGHSQGNGKDLDESITSTEILPCQAKETDKDVKPVELSEYVTTLNVKHVRGKNAK